jgi:chloramphenicol-sensitive protein RarD
MALSITIAALLMQMSRKVGFTGHLVTISKYNCWFTYDMAVTAAVNAGFTPGYAPDDDAVFEKDNGMLLGSVFFRMLGFSQVTEMEYEGSGEAGCVLTDLNRSETPASLVGQADAVFDLGTSEHIFHFPNLLAHMGRILKPKGLVLHHASDAGRSLSDSQSTGETRRGVLFALACYGSWGMFPVFWRSLGELPPADVLAWRVVWSLLAVLVLVGWERRWDDVSGLLGSRGRLAVLAASTLCISVNWLVFIAAIGSGKILEASMGYFLNPLVNVALGVMVLKERLRPLQWLAVGLAVAGVAQLAVVTGSPPWVALILAATFGLYGLLRKRLPVAPLIGLAVETGLMLPFALVWLTWRMLAEGAPMLGGTLDLALMLAASGPVTALPLLWFAAAASRMRYTSLGFFQYLAPTGHFLLAVLAYGEVPGPSHRLTFICIWVAILLYCADTWRQHRLNAA